MGKPLGPGGEGSLHLLLVMAQTQNEVARAINIHFHISTRLVATQNCCSTDIGPMITVMKAEALLPLSPMYTPRAAPE